MNKNIKNIFVGIMCAMFIVPVFGADVSVAERMDCSALSTRIGELVAIENPDDATATELAQLQTQYRNNCARSSGGRPASGRVSTMSVVATSADTTPIAVPVATVITAYSALTDYLTARRSLCDDLSADITTLKNSGTSDDELQPLRNQYSADCGDDIDKSAVVIDTETAVANMAAGLCPNGDAPNKFGCCDGETFQDTGNLEFMCCPDDGDGECHAPLNDGSAIPGL